MVDTNADASNLEYITALAESSSRIRLSLNQALSLDRTFGQAYCGEWSFVVHGLYENEYWALQTDVLDITPPNASYSLGPQQITVGLEYTDIGGITRVKNIA